MAIGQVKWFNNQKGYGFLETPDSKQDVFVHFSDIEMEGYKTLKEKSWVYFVLEERDRGPNARQVSPLLSEGTEHKGLTDGVTRQVDEIQAAPEQTEAHDMAWHDPALDDEMHMPSQRFNKRNRHAKSTERASMA